ncbi:unnamed protein product, partial [Prorocentrum cordatum]
LLILSAFFASSAAKHATTWGANSQGAPAATAARPPPLQREPPGPHKGRQRGPPEGGVRRNCELEARGARRGELEAPAPARQDGRAVACIIRQYKRARARACLGPLAVEKARGRHRGGGGGGGGGGGRGREEQRQMEECPNAAQRPAQRGTGSGKTRSYRGREA